MARPTRLTYTGQYLDFGRGQPEPDRHYQGVPARDLNEEDLAQFSDEDIKLIMGGDDPLYVDPDAGPKPPTGLQALTVSDLRKEAKSRGIDLAGAKRKDDIIARLEGAADQPAKVPAKASAPKQAPPAPKVEPEPEPEPMPESESAPTAESEPFLFEDVGEPATHESA
jgi:pyruvate/2-oxoglutarate dehydrogenase complex dihydrolipoamide acyltransferase (E2) component